MSPSAVASVPEDPVAAPRHRKRRARAADRALADVYRQHHRFMWRSLVRLGVPDDRLDDAVHDAFMVVARRLDEFEGRAALRTWLFAIAMRIAQSVRRDAARQRDHRETMRAKVRALTPDSHVPQDRADAARTLRDLLGHLSDEQRAVFIMAELEGMTAKEIAGVVGAKPATVTSRLRLARQQLNRELERRAARERREAP